MCQQRHGHSSSLQRVLYTTITQQRRHLITGESAPGWYTVRTLTCFSLHNLGYKQHPSLALWAYFGQFEGVVGLLR